jgi:hypothetical protein
LLLLVRTYPNDDSEIDYELKGDDIVEDTEEVLDFCKVLLRKLAVCIVKSRQQQEYSSGLENTSKTITIEY